MRANLTLVVWLILLFSIPSYGKEAYLRAQLQELDLQALSDQVESSLMVKNAATGEVIYSRNENLLLNPASNAKILTSLAALSYLSPDFRFKTQLIGGEGKPFPKKKKKKKKAAKNKWKVGKDGHVPILTLKGYGDPTFTSYDLRRMIRKLRDKGVRSVGEVRIDNSYFDNSTFPGREDFNQRFFNLGAFFLDENQIEVMVTPGDFVGSPAKIELQPPVASLVLEGEILTRKRGAKIRISPSYGYPKALALRVSGSIAMGSAPQFLKISYEEPEKVAGHQILALLRQLGIRAPDQFSFKTPPWDGKLIVENQSTRLKEVLPVINKKSDNFLAEQITKVLGAEYSGQPGSTKKGIQAMLRELDATGVDVSGIYLENGSGLSRNSRVKTISLVSALQKVYDNPRLREPFIETLSILGVDGTLRRRFRDTELEGRFVGKTGTLRGVSTLTGFAYPISGAGKKTYILSHLINGSGKDFWRRKQLTQDIIQLLLSQ